MHQFCAVEPSLTADPFGASHAEAPLNGINARSKVLVMLDSACELAGNRLVDATFDVFGRAAIDVDVIDLACFGDVGAADDEVESRWLRAQAILMIASSTRRCAELIDRLDDDKARFAGRAYGLIFDADGSNAMADRRSISEVLDAMGLIDAGAQARLDRFVGYEQTYTTRHDDVFADDRMQQDALSTARAVANAVIEISVGRLTQPDLLLDRTFLN